MWIGYIYLWLIYIDKSISSCCKSLSVVVVIVSWQIKKPNSFLSLTWLDYPSSIPQFPLVGLLPWKRTNKTMASAIFSFNLCKQLQLDKRKKYPFWHNPNFKEKNLNSQSSSTFSTEQIKVFIPSHIYFFNFLFSIFLDFLVPSL